MEVSAMRTELYLKYTGYSVKQKIGKLEIKDGGIYLTALHATENSVTITTRIPGSVQLPGMPDIFYHGQIESTITSNIPT